MYLIHVHTHMYAADKGQHSMYAGDSIYVQWNFRNLDTIGPD